ncbi:hypothetical protein BHE74_00007054 [Ensete ventricosum]|nr:hypothetical protein BHE74_00007054 [Ensete ventricosum]
MLTIAKNALSRKKIVMVVPRLLIWEAPRPISSLNVKSMDLRKDDPYPIFI